MSEVNKTLCVLRQARALIENPDDWWNGREASATRTKQCIVEALSTVAVFGYRDFYQSALQRLTTVCGRPVLDFNDSSTHQEILAAFDKAIEIEAQTGVEK